MDMGVKQTENVEPSFESVESFNDVIHDNGVLIHVGTLRASTILDGNVDR